MVTPPEIEAQILRLYHAEKWLIGTIAQQLHVHYSVVGRVLAQAGLPRPGPPPRKSRIDPYLTFIRRTLETFPALTASRLYVMVRERGYRGSPDHFRHLIACHRPRPKVEAYLRLRSLAGEQGQVDWGHFGHLEIGRARRPLMAFVMVLSHSRQIFLRFFPDARMENFLRGHVAAFTAWNGVPRVLLYDNLRSAVLERHGEAIRFHPTLLGFAGHYRYEPRPVAMARGNEKGRVERAIRYVREAFFAARSFAGLDDLNAQADAWCNGPAADRGCPDEPERTVRQVFADEAPRLLALPGNPAPLLQRVAVSVGKTPYVRFDRNDYSVPHTHVRRILTVLADPHEVRIADGADILARHRRSYDKGAQIEDPAHIQRLVDDKRAARQHSANDRLAQAAPASQTLRRDRQRNLGHVIARLGGTGARPPQSGTTIAHCPYRPLQAALRLRLGLAQALRPRRHRHADDAGVPQRGHQRRARRAERRRQVDDRPEHRPPGSDPRPYCAVHQRRPAARRSLRTRQRFRSAPPSASLRPPASARHRRGRLPLLLQPSCRADVRADLAAVPEQEHPRHHQPQLRRMARGVPQRRMRRLAGRSSSAQLRDRRHRRRVLSPQGSSRSHRTTRTPAPRRQIMSTPPEPPQLPAHLRASTVEISRTWTPEEALAVFELIDDLRDKICALYNLQLQDLLRQQCAGRREHADDQTRDHRPT